MKGVTIKLAYSLSKLLADVNSLVLEGENSLVDVDRSLERNPTSENLLSRKHYLLVVQLVNMKDKVDNLVTAKSDFDADVVYEELSVSIKAAFDKEIKQSADRIKDLVNELQSLNQ